MRKKVLKTLVMAVILLTAIIAVTSIQNRNQNAGLLINGYTQSFFSGSPTVIREKNGVSSNYNFTGNFSETINLVAGKTVIDGEGYNLPGSGLGEEFYLNGGSNVTIENVTVTGWQCGFYLQVRPNESTLSDNTTNNNREYVFYLKNNSYNNITGTNIVDLSYGSHLGSNSYKILENNTWNIGVLLFNIISLFQLIVDYTQDSQTWDHQKYFGISTAILLALYLIGRWKRKGHVEAEVLPRPVPTSKWARCLFCGSEIPEDAEFCPSCGAARAMCSVCNHEIISEDQFVMCPYCDALSHKDHLLDWVKIKGYCPNCRHKLKKREIA